MVAAYGHGSAIDKAHDNINRPFRIGAISDVIAEANYPFRAPRRARSRHALNACRLAWISANTASSTFLRGYDTACSGAGLDGYQTTPRQWAAIAPKAGNGMPPWHSNKPRGAAAIVRGDDLAFTRRFQAPEQQGQQGVDPRG
jgi:hypothetical protein